MNTACLASLADTGHSETLTTMDQSQENQLTPGQGLPAPVYYAVASHQGTSILFDEHGPRSQGQPFQVVPDPRIIIELIPKGIVWAAKCGDRTALGFGPYDAIRGVLDTSTMAFPDSENTES